MLWDIFIEKLESGTSYDYLISGGTLNCFFEEWQQETSLILA